MPPRRRPPWWPQDEAWPPERWPPAFHGGPGGRGRHMPVWGMGWGRGGTGIAFLLGLALRALGFLLLSIAFVTILGYLGAAVMGVATAPVGTVVVGIAAVVGLIAVLPFAWRALRRARRPLDRLVAAAGRVEAGDYSVRVPEDGPADIRSLERAFNQMSERLEAGDRARRTFLADVSHELRTPLTVMRGQLEAIADGVYPADAAHLEPVLAQAGALERLVDDLRTVALAEAGALPLRREPVELAALARAVATDLGPAARAGEVTIEVAAPDLTPISADPALLRRVLANVAGNAVRHTPAGGVIRLELTDLDRGWQRLTVTDSGPGIPPALLPRVFERFVKGPGSDGTGLGLAIARDLVTAHGGAIGVESPVTGAGGTRVVIELPVGAGAAA